MRVGKQFNLRLQGEGQENKLIPTQISPLPLPPPPLLINNDWSHGTSAGFWHVNLTAIIGSLRCNEANGNASVKITMQK